MMWKQKLKRWAGRHGTQKLFHLFVGMALSAGPLNFVQAEVAQTPLFLGGGNVPGNMVLVPSVEWPTIESVANLDSNYSSSKNFVGYFDPNKCYIYEYRSNEDDRRFEPSSITDNKRCGGSAEWSGNFLNWATTQTIDPFRKVLTGGLRALDTPTETWLEKARHPGQGSGFPIRDLNNSTEVARATPFSSNRIRVRIDGLGTQLRFSLNNADVNNNIRTFENAASVENNRSYNMSVRVKVCDASVGVEENCRQYSQGWKPEGLIQQNASEIRFSVFSFLNDSRNVRDGGVLRARQKYVGPTRFVPGEGAEENPNREWDPQTGVMVRNPNPDDAEATASNISRSGVMNYLNQFGQYNTGNNKSTDPVSELYYAATRYLKNLGNVPEYSSISGNNADTYRDGFPVIEDWDDPIQYECQPNVLLGIGDTNTHDDKNLPGNTSYRADEPSMPGEVADDDTVNVIAVTNKVGDLENIGTLGQSNSFTGRENSAYIAGLAYDNHTRDMRPDLAGTQTASTHWVDVLENQVLQPSNRNQYYLAAKYGGFDVPDDFDPMSRTDPLEEGWWYTNAETLSNGERRPDNFYVAGEAERMVESLRRAFANISAELSSSSAAVAANSTRLEADTAVFQAAFDSTNWSGDLLAYAITETGDIVEDPAWSAAELLDAENNNFMRVFRNILTNDPVSDVGAVDDELLAYNGKSFSWDDLTLEQREQIRATEEGPLVDVDVGQDRLNYLRGDRSNEQSDDNTARPFRLRDSRLGDVVNSNPQFIHQQDFGYGALNLQDEYTDIVSYNVFRSSDVYQDRVPLLVVGANDGMLHGFNADVTGGNEAGKELFAYVPSSVMDNLYELTLPDYEHRYYVDGTPRVADAWLGDTLGWRTLAVGTTGAGGRSVFALDITNPSSVTETNVMWEFSHPDMGITKQQPAIVALANGEFGVVVTSGYETSGEGGRVWILNAATGRPIETFELDDSGELGSPLVVDLNRDRIADRIYVGDTEGQLWRLDIEDSNADQWGEPGSLNGNPLFDAGDEQPITASMASAFNEEGEHMVYFGTGSFFQVGDNVISNDPDIQSFYGIIDRSQSLDRSDLLEQEILTRVTQEGLEFSAVSANELTSESGWYIDLIWKESLNGPGAEGERVTARPLVRGDRVIFTTLIPSEDPCAAGGQGRLYEVNSFSGSRLSYSVFDVNNDGFFDENDFIEIEIDGEPVRVPVSALSDEDLGIINTPSVLTGVGEAGDERKIISGSSGQMISVPEAGSATRGRQTWEQIR